MQAYRIIGRGFHVGAGALLILGAAQAAERAHRVETLKAGKAFSLVSAKEVQAFKVGELLGLAEPPKGQLEAVEAIKAKDADAAPLFKAVAEFNQAAEQAERKRLMEIEAGEKKRAADAAAAADAADVATWTQEFNTIDGVKEKHGKLESYIAYRRAERDKAAA